MDLSYVTAAGVRDVRPDQVRELLDRDDGYVWIDVTDWSAQTQQFLASVFAFHPVALELCATRNQMPMVHGYADHVFAVLHRPVVVSAGRVVLYEIDMFLGDGYLVTVHEGVEPVPGTMSEVAETRARIDAGRIVPADPSALLHAIVSLIALRQRLVVQEVAARVGAIEDRVLGREMADPERSLDEMFMLRYELLSVRTAAAHSEEVMARTRKVLTGAATKADDQLADLQDLFRRVHRMANSEQDFLAGVIDLYRARTDTKMMIATERLAVLAAVTLPVTAIASVYGMNVIVNPRTEPIQLIIVLLVMIGISGLLLRWTKRLGWW